LPSKRVGKRLTTQNLSREIVLKRIVVVEAPSGHNKVSLAHAICVVFATRVAYTPFLGVKCR